MTGTYTIPPANKVVGNTGMVADLDNVYEVLASTPLLVFNVQNTAYSGGADPTGAADCSAAVNAAITAADSAGGGIIYFPAGSYKLTAAVTYSGAHTLRFLGDGIQATKIRMNINASSSTYFSITNTGSWGDQLGADGSCSFEEMSFYNDHYVGAFSNTNIGIYMSGVNFGVIRNCAFYKGTGSQRILQAIVLNATNQVLVDNCNIFSVVNGIALTGFNQVNAIRDTSIWQPSGSAVATAASLLFSGQCLGVNLKHVVFHDGDRGLLWTQDAGTNKPHLLVANDVEFNNHTITACEIDYGTHVYLNGCIFSGASGGSGTPGLLFGSNFEGDAHLVGCKFIGMTGHSVDIEGGAGYVFTACEFGGSSTYKTTTNTYDEIFINASPSVVTVSGCVFNVGATTIGLGSNVPRSAVYVTAGATDVELIGCRGAGSGYGTATVVDNANVVMKRGNIGLGLADEKTGSGATATSAVSFQNLSASITIPKYDMVVGKVYRFVVQGHGTQATGSAVNLSVRGNVGGQSLGTFTPVTNPAAAAAFFWKYELTFRVTVVGASGTATMTVVETFTWGASGVAAGTTMHGSTAFTTFDTTADNAIVMTAEWASATGSPTITGDMTVLTPMQNWPAS